MESASLLVFIKGILLWQFGGSRLAAARLFVIMCLQNDDCARSSERARIETYFWLDESSTPHIAPAHQSGRGLKLITNVRAANDVTIAPAHQSGRGLKHTNRNVLHDATTLRPLIRAGED